MANASQYLQNSVTGSRFQVDAQRELLQAEAKEPVQRKEEGKQPNPTKPNQANLHQPGSSLLNNNKKQRPKAKVKAEGEGKEKKGEGKEKEEERNVYIYKRGGGRERNWVSSRGGSGALWEERFRRSSHRTPYIGALQASCCFT